MWKQILTLGFLLPTVVGRQFQLTSVGCFNDFQNGFRDMRELKDFGFNRLGDKYVQQGTFANYQSEMAVYSAHMTHELCGQVCSLGGFQFIGLQANQWCFCSNSYGSQGAAPLSDCSGACTGNSAQICGFPYRNFVVRLSYTHNQRLFVPGNWTLVGISKPDAPSYRTVGTLGIAECLYRCRAGCEAVIFNQQQLLCHLLEFAVVPAALSNSRGDFFVRG